MPVYWQDYHSILYIRDELDERWLPVVGKLELIPNVNTFGLVEDMVLQRQWWDGWQGAMPTLGWLTNVGSGSGGGSPSAPSHGDIIVYNASTQFWEYSSGSDFSSGSGGGGASYLDDLLDVNLGSPDEGDVLTYESGEWVSSVPTGGSSPSYLNDILDVNLGTPSQGDVLTYDSGEWVSSAPTGGSAGAGAGGARVTMSSGQTIPNITNESIDFEAENEDDADYWSAGSPGMFIIPADGWYLISYQANWESSALGERYLNVRVNGSLYLATVGDRITSAFTLRQQVHYLGFLEKGDYTENVVWQNSGAGEDVLFARGSIYNLTSNMSGGGTSGSGGGAQYLDDLLDVNEGTPNDGNVLTYDDGSGQWISAAPTGGSSGGDMYKSVYDTDDDGIVDSAGSSGVAGLAQLAEVATEANTAGSAGVAGTSQTANTADSATTADTAGSSGVAGDTQRIVGRIVDAVSSPSDNQVMAWDVGANKWVYADQSGSGGGGTSGSAGYSTPTTEDLTAQVPGTHFDTSYVFLPNSLSVYYNGVRQQVSKYTEDENQSGFTLVFSAVSGDTLVVDYYRGATSGSAATISVKEVDDSPALSGIHTIVVGSDDLIDLGSGFARIKTAADVTVGPSDQDVLMIQIFS